MVDGYKYREDMKYYVPSFKTEFYHVFLYTGHTSSLALNILVIYIYIYIYIYIGS